MTQTQKNFWILSNSMKKILLGWYVIMGVVMFSSVFSFQPRDWLTDAYDDSHNPGTSDPYASDVEADDLFKNSWSSAGGESIITRTARFMLRLAVILWIPLLLYVGIKIMLALGDSGKLNTALKEGWMVAAGLLIALLSVAIIFLITSLTRSSLGEI